MGKRSWWCFGNKPDTQDPQVIITNQAKENSVSIISPTLSKESSKKRSETQTIYHWSGFRSKDEDIRPKLCVVNTHTEIHKITGTSKELIFLLEDGSVWAWYEDEKKEIPANLQPIKMDFSPSVKITSISSGKFHTLALDEEGSVYSWGSNQFGQLGLGLGQELCPGIKFPRLVKSIASKVVVQIATGENHSVVLTDMREIYTCGSNRDGQLGGGGLKEAEYSSVFVPILQYPLMPWAFISSGGNSTVALSVHGEAFGWGDNSHSQLKDVQEIASDSNTLDKDGVPPVMVTGVTRIPFPVSLEFDPTWDILIGKAHLMLTTVGRSSSIGCQGSNKFNQQGPEFNEGVVTQVACGDYHTLVVGDGKLYCYGPERNETDRDMNGENQPLPIPVQLLENIRHFSVFAFGMTSIVLPREEAVPRRNFLATPFEKMLQLSEDDISSYLTLASDHSPDPGIKSKFRNLLQGSVWNASFVQAKSDMGLQGIGLPDPEHFGNKLDLSMAENIIRGFWSVQCLELLDLLNRRLSDWLGELNEGSELNAAELPIIAYLPLFILDIPASFILVHDLGKVNHQQILQQLSSSSSLFRNANSWSSSLDQTYLLEFANCITEKLKAVTRAGVLDLIYYCYNTEQLERLVSAYKRLIVSVFKFHKVDEALALLRDSLRFLSCLWHRNKKEKRISNYCFMIPQMGKLVDVFEEHTSWIGAKTLPNAESKRYAYLCNYPFLFDPSTKAELLEFEQNLQMIGARAISSIFQPVAFQEFVLAVRRENLVDETLKAIQSYDPFDLKKPLRVHFIGEEGQDAGGVKKEFFLLLIRELLDLGQESGHLEYNEDSKLVWFTSTEEAPLSAEIDFLFIFGVFCGLAIYNKIIINLPFPLALYKKIIGDPCDIEDLSEISPTEARSLKNILEHSASDFEDTFQINFEISRHVLGATKTVELKEDGKNVPVDQDNKKEFVDSYIDYHFNKSVEHAFAQFRRGFNLVFQDSWAVKFFTAEELREIIIGNEDYVWEELQEGCKYSGVYDETHGTIKLFWEVFHDLDASSKKNFLLFLTGSDRVPISGMAHINIVINSSVEDESYFPVAHTCFNTLDLPIYRSRLALEKKLLSAIEHKEGFHLA